MKSRYMIGFFAVFILVVAALSAGYQMTYDRVIERQASQESEVPGAGSVAAEGQEVTDGTDTEDGFYLCELQGFVAVYLSDRKTIFEFTEIPLTDLPEEVQQEVAEGKFIRTKQELYAFLENYSS